MAITTAQRTEILQLTLAMFDATPGAKYLSEFTAIIDSGATTENLANALDDTGVFTSIYPNFMTNEEFAVKFLDNFVGDLVPQSAKDWAVLDVTARLDAGSTRGEVMWWAAQALDAVDPAVSVNWGAAALAFDNQVEVSNYYSVVQNQSATSLVDLQSVLAGVTNDPATVDDAKSQIDGDLPDSGDVFTLTVGQDTILGTGGDDTILGFVNDDVVAGTTLNSGDTINGADGFDTLKVTIESTSDNDLNLNMKNVEKIEVRDFDGQTFYVQNVTGLNTISIVGGDDEDTYFDSGTYIIPNVEFHNVEGYIEQDAGKVAVVDNVNILVDNADAEAYFYSDNDASTANYMTANITSIGAGFNSGQNYLYLGESRGAHTVNVTGTTDLELDIEHFSDDDGNASVTLVDASTLEAGLETTVRFEDDAAFMGGTGDDDVTDQSADNGSEISIDTGAGDDSISISGGGTTNVYTVEAGEGDDTFAAGNNLNIESTVDGGDGFDTLSVNNAQVIAVNALTDAQKDQLNAAITNFEELSISNQLTVDIDVTDFGGINALTLGGGAGTVVVEGMTSGATLEYNANATSVTLDIDGAAAGAADEVNVALTSANLINAGDLFVADVETINFTSTDTNTTDHKNILDLEATSATAINVSGDAGLFLNNIGLDAVTSFDASGHTGDDGVDFISSNVTDSVSLTGGTGDDNLDAFNTIADEVATVNGGEGDDLIIGGAGADVLNGEAGDDEIYGWLGKDAIDGGDGDDLIGGEGGIDTLTGGAGEDAFTYFAVTDSQGTTVDVITDFVSLEDVIDLNNVLGGAGTYLGEATGYGAVLTSLTGTVGDAVLDDSTSTLYVDVDGDAALTDADMAIQLTGVTVLDAADIVF